MRMLKVPAPDHMDSALYKLFQRDNSALQGCSSGFGTISHVEFVEHVADVQFHRHFGDIQSGPNLFVAHSLGDQAEDFKFAGSQHATAHACGQHRCDCGI